MQLNQMINSLNLHIKRLVVFFILYLLILFCFTHNILAQNKQDVSIFPHEIGSQGPNDLKELEVFIDGVIASQLEAHNIPGAAIAVVKDGELFFSKGYGYADFENQRLVNANKTLFRVASISKLFTWTAVMQLVERGKLDLHTDINVYLKELQIPDTYPQPVTLAHLMTHTSGFAEKWIGLAPRSADEIIPLGKYLLNNIPSRVHPPGDLTGYTNVGADLAGYIVEKVSGISFNRYVEENIFKPLGMSHSTFRQPVPADLSSNLAKGYSYTNGMFVAGEITFHHSVPAATMWTTATDLAKFMITHLQGGSFYGVHILQENTVKEMHQQQFTNDPQVNGWTYGFAEANDNNQRIITHVGNFDEFYSQLILLPERELGVFVSYNSHGGIPARNELMKVFLDRYFPEEQLPVPEPPDDFQKRARRYTGFYIYSSHNETSLDKIEILTDSFRVIATSKGKLQIGANDEASQWIEIEPLVFRNVLGEAILVLRENKRHQIIHIFFDDYPYYAFLKLRWYESPLFHWSILGACTILYFSMILILPIGFLVKRKKGIPRTLTSGLMRWVIWGISVLNVVFVIWMYVLLSSDEMFYGVSSIINILLIIPFLTIAGGFGFFIIFVLTWKKRLWSIFNRIHFTLVTVSTLVYIWWLNYWNLLGYQF
jgi:CubicO group peptidase (beta-lactamase class C family)